MNKTINIVAGNNPLNVTLTPNAPVFPWALGEIVSTTDYQHAGGFVGQYWTITAISGTVITLTPQIGDFDPVDIDTAQMAGGVPIMQYLGFVQGYKIFPY